MSDIEISQVDRDLVESFGDLWLTDAFEAAITAVARHRHEARADALEEAAKVAETNYADTGYHPAARNAGLGIAEAIRALRSGEREG